jgi:hypothetical protein
VQLFQKETSMFSCATTWAAFIQMLTLAAPDWLMSHLHSDWFDRYHRRVENYRLPKLDSEREALGNLIGKDGFALLDAIYARNSPEWLHQIPAVEILRQVWIQQFYAPAEDGSVQWRTTKDMPPSTVAIHSPYDVEAHYSSKVVLTGWDIKPMLRKFVVKSVLTLLLRSTLPCPQYPMIRRLNLSIKPYPRNHYYQLSI